MNLARLLFALPFFLACTTLPQSKTVFVVRHAEKASNDKDAELSEAGKARAIRLAQTLEKEKVTRVFSTNFRRTRDTVAPTASMHQIAVENYSTTKELAFKISDAQDTILIAGHSNTVPEIVEQLSGKKQNEIQDTDFGNLFAVVLVNGQKRVIHLRY